MNKTLKQIAKVKRLLDKRFNPILGKSRQKKIKSTSFTIISNNCWGGMVYQFFNLQYSSPTVGLYFFPDEYLRMLQSLPYYLSPEAKLSFISYKESKYSDELEKRGQTQVPIGLLNGDVEIVFLHYSSVDEAREKWFRRVKRINWDHLLYKFSQMNNCTDSQVELFLSLNLKNKICLVNRKSITNLKDCIYYHVYDAEGEQITNDTDFPFKGISIYKLLNSLFL